MDHGRRDYPPSLGDRTGLPNNGNDREHIEVISAIPSQVRVPKRIAADLDTLSLVPNDPHADKESNHHDPRARHRHELAEPPPKPKKLSQREQRTALRAGAGTTATIKKSDRVFRKTERP